MSSFCLRLVVSALAVMLLLSAASCSKHSNNTNDSIADYGNSGADFARRLAAQYPRREPFSSQEKDASAFISNQLSQYGYQTEIQEFSATAADGSTGTSRNVIARLKGSGFHYAPKTKESGGQASPERYDNLIMIIGAHYDTPAVREAPREEGVTEIIEADGIHNNASGVAAVMTAARVMRDVKPGYDVIFVFFGAGTDSYAGAKHFLQSLTDSERSRVDAMINVGPIFAGDKVYAHAGQNSVIGGQYKDYAKRRKLYQATDIFFDFKLNTKNGYAIYTNQASFTAGLPNGKDGIFREWTTKLSDHTPFDEAGIPVVFIESGEYRIKSIDEVGLESKNPLFISSAGVISGTSFDRTRTLEDLFKDMEEQAARQTLPLDWMNQDDEQEQPDESDIVEHGRRQPRMPMRVNNTAFVLVQLARKGPLDYEFDGA
ncbi:MAG TPA: M28 family peptidase [Bacillota bacterium]|nr:M28 family peptidase [Bacillota bacterium]